ncbi:Flp pilus assembly protein CpaB [Geoalkalibacter sp.]|uniref:Flp pilus assembly protein CpaB n=1 Tax=Geoalkalibacter sp. TaxID=3041440 RepID=UPI00272E4011|nr:Flp pilus assembly protein CpaB [Geoalkalibacter sp.]
MKKYGAVLALSVAILSGLFAVVLANRWLSRQTPPEVAVIQQEAVPTARVVIAARDLEVGTPLSAANLTLADWPRGGVPQGSFSDVAACEGRVAVARLRAGHPVLAADLAAPGSGPGLVAAIAPGHRAMAIRVDEVIGVGGFILPNTYVDVIAIDDQGNKAVKARTLLERIEVLAIAQETTNEDGKPKVVKTVTLKLSPEQAEKLALQTSQGSVQLALRNPLDEVAPQLAPQVAQVEAPPAQVYRPRPRAPQPPKAPPFAVEVIRRSDAEEIKFKNVESEEKI